MSLQSRIAIPLDKAAERVRNMPTYPVFPMSQVPSDELVIEPLSGPAAPLKEPKEPKEPKEKTSPSSKASRSPSDKPKKPRNPALVPELPDPGDNPEYKAVSTAKQRVKNLDKGVFAYKHPGDINAHEEDTGYNTYSRGKGFTASKHKDYADHGSVYSGVDPKIAAMIKARHEKDAEVTARIIASAKKQ